MEQKLQDMFTMTEGEEKEGLTELKNALTTLNTRYQQLSRNDKLDWSETNEAKALINFLGEYPPIKLLEDVLSFYKNKKHEIVTKYTPPLLQAAGIKRIVLDSGNEVYLKDEISYEVVDEKAFEQWLISHGHSDSYKETLVFPKGELKKEFVDMLCENGVTFESRKGIHASTLKSIISKRYEEKEELPEETILKVKPFTMAKFK